MPSDDLKPRFIEHPWRIIGFGAIAPVVLIYKAVGIFETGFAHYKFYASSSVKFELHGIYAELYAVELICGALFLHFHCVWAELFPENRGINLVRNILAWITGAIFVVFLLVTPFR